MDVIGQRGLPPENPQRFLDHEAHVWLVSPGLLSRDEQVGPLRAILSSEERARADRFIFEKDRHLFTVAHGALRHVLSKYANREPQDWQFEQGVHGRPEITAEQNPDKLRFNLSHTAGLVACVVNRSHDSGVDVEQIGRVRDALSLAKGFFSQFEYQMLQKCRGEEDLQILFCRYWTLKEAYIKALGKGLTIPLDDFYFTFDNHDIQIHFAADDADPGETWHLYQVRPTDGHLLSAAVKTEKETRLDFKVFEY